MAFTIGLASLVPEHSWICSRKHQKKDLYRRRMSTTCSIVKNENQICQSLRGLRDLAQTGQYKAWLLDQFGVLHDGQRPYRGAIATLEQLAQTGIKIVIISNSSRRALTTLEKMRKLGFDPSLFDGAITSGELTHQYLLRRNDPWFAALGRCCIHMTWSERGAISLEGLGLQIVEDLESADFILAHGTEAIGLESGNGAKKMELEKLEQILENAVDKGIPMIVANPDHVTVEARALHVMPGTLGTKYEQLGGQVRWMGKPDQVGDMVLLWHRKNEKPGKHKKFDSLWLGPYIIRGITRPNSFHLSTLEREPLQLPANGQLLKLFFKDDI